MIKITWDSQAGVFIAKQDKVLSQGRTEIEALIALLDAIELLERPVYCDPNHNA